MSTPSQPGSWPPPNDPSNPYSAAPGGTGYGAPSAPGGGYPGGAYPGGPYGAAGAPASRPSRPGTVTLSFLLWVAGAVGTVIAVVAYVNQLDWTAVERLSLDAARQNGQNLTSADFQNLRGAFIGAAYAFLGIGVVLHLFFAFMMWTGRNWARIVLTVFGAFEIVSGVQSVASLNAARTLSINGVSFTVPSPWITIILGLVALAAIVLMYLAPSNAYFRDSKAFRQAAKYR